MKILTARITALEAENKRLREALEPPQKTIEQKALDMMPGVFKRRAAAALEPRG